MITKQDQSITRGTPMTMETPYITMGAIFQQDQSDPLILNIPIKCVTMVSGGGFTRGMGLYRYKYREIVGNNGYIDGMLMDYSFNVNGLSRNTSRDLMNVGNPGCHKPTMTGNGFCPTH